MVQQHDVVGAAFHTLDRLLPGGHHIRPDSQKLQEICADLPVHIVVIDYQYPGLRCAYDLLLVPVFVAFLKSEPVIPYGSFVRYFLSQGKAEAGALPVDTVDGKRAVHQRQKALDNGKPEPGALDGMISDLIEPLKGFEQGLPVLRPDSYARIPYGDVQEHGLLFLFFDPHSKGDRSRRRVFHGVCEEIHYHLREPDIVPEKSAGNRFVYIGLKAQALCVRPLQHGIDKVIDKGGGIVFDGDDLHLPVLDLGKVQNAVYQRKQRFPRGINVSCVLQDVLVVLLA